MAALTLADIEDAERRIRPFIRRTPLLESNQRPGLHLKLECMQRTGSFKLRGALNAVLAADEATVRDGVSCISAGNHGLGVAVAAKQRGVKARVYVMPGAVPRKVEAMRAQGAEVVEAPVPRLGEMMAKGDSMDGHFFIDPFANRHVAAGQGTAGLELFADLARPDAVFVPIGGGGLAYGIATVAKARSPATKVYGVVAQGTPAFRNAWQTGKAETVKSDSIADGLAAPIANMAVVVQLKGLLADLVTVSDDAIRKAMRGLALDDKVVAEPAGAAATAAALEAKRDGATSVALVSGGNARPDLVAQVLG